MVTILAFASIVSTANAGKLTNCEDVEQYARKVADSMYKGASFDSWVTPYDSRYATSNSIVRYVYSLKGISKATRIASLAYTKCRNGSYGTHLK